MQSFSDSRTTVFSASGFRNHIADIGSKSSGQSQKNSSGNDAQLLACPFPQRFGISVPSHLCGVIRRPDTANYYQIVF